MINIEGKFDTENFRAVLKTRFKEDILSLERLKERRLNVDIKAGPVVKIAEFLHNELNFRFIIATAMHTGRGIEIFYHFSDDSSSNIINVRVVLDENNAEIESLTGVFPAADWIEREMHEIMGINFINHPNLEKLLSEGNWAAGVYPYRKDNKREDGQ